MRLAVLFSICLLSVQLNAQQKFFFPKAAYQQPEVLRKSIPTLAQALVPLIDTSDVPNYQDMLMRIQITAGHYPQAIAAVQELRKLIAGNDPASVQAVGFQFETFAATAAQTPVTDTSFLTTYAATFQQYYQRLPAASQPEAENAFGADTSSLNNRFSNLLVELASANTDSLSLKDALTLCRQYCSYQVYNTVQSKAKSLLTIIDNQQYLIQDSVLIKVRDGAQLSAVIVRKKTALNQPLPVILLYNIYAGPGDRAAAKLAASKGYVGMVVNTRGKYLSPQKIEPFEHDATDGYDMIDWISKQSFCNGSVGMYGGSYLGFSQWSTVKKLHPALKTIVPQVAVGIGVDYPLHNGVFMQYMLQWIHFVSNNKLTDYYQFTNSQHWDSLNNKLYQLGLPFKKLDSLDGQPNPLFQRWLQHPSYDAYWRNMAPFQQDFSRINIPVLTTTGYMDDDQRGAFHYYNQHHRYNPKAADNHYLLIGPYNHAGAQSTALQMMGGYEIDSVANISINEVVFQWFDHWLKNGAMPALLSNKVNWQVMGANQWKHAASIKDISNDTLRLYLSNQTAGKYFHLNKKAGKGNRYVQQTIDLSNRNDIDSVWMNPPIAPTIIDSVLYAGAALRFISDPLPDQLEMNGSFVANLLASINKKDMDLSINVYEQLPSGKYFSLSSFIGRASYHLYDDKRHLLTPNQWKPLQLSNTFFVSKLLQKGSKLVVTIGINKSKYWQINYGSGKEVSEESMLDAGAPMQLKLSDKSYIAIPVFRN